MKSDSVKKGMQTAPQRSLFNALGLTKEELEKPLVAIVSSYNEIVPGHMNLDKIVEAAKLGVAMAGGTPIVFPAIAVCDGIAMGHVGMKYSLVTRDLIADSTECMALAHAFDAMVMVPNCDKNVPGLLTALKRVVVLPAQSFCPCSPTKKQLWKRGCCGRGSCASPMRSALSWIAPSPPTAESARALCRPSL